MRRRDVLLGILGSSMGGGCALSTWNPKYSKDGLHNINDTRCVTPQRELTPTSLADLVRWVKEAETSGARIRAVGAGHSYSDSAFIDGWIVRMLSLKREIPVRGLRKDVDGSMLRCFEGGVRLQGINEIIAGKQAFPIMGGWDQQTLAGVVSTSTHGSSLSYGPFPSIVASLVVVVAEGEVLQIEPKDGVTDRASFLGVTLPDGSTYPATLVQDDDAFNAALVAFGSMGIIYSLTIKLVPHFKLHEEKRLSTWEECIAPGGFLDHLIKHNAPPQCDGWTPEFYEMLVSPYAFEGAHAVAITCRRKIDQLSHKFGCDARPLLETFFGWEEQRFPYVVPDLLHRKPEGAPKLMAGAVKDVRDDCYEGDGPKVFNSGNVNNTRGYSVEVAVELWKTPAAVQRVLDVSRDLLANREGVHSGPLSLRFVQCTDALLAPQHKRPTTMVEIFTLPGVLGSDNMLREHERELVTMYGARPHWGLDLNALESFDQVRELYGRANADTWLQRYKTANRTGVFNGEITDRLGISIPNANASTHRSAPCRPIKV